MHTQEQPSLRRVLDMTECHRYTTETKNCADRTCSSWYCHLGWKDQRPAISSKAVHFWLEEWWMEWQVIIRKKQRVRRSNEGKWLVHFAATDTYPLTWDFGGLREKEQLQLILHDLKKFIKLWLFTHILCTYILYINWAHRQALKPCSTDIPISWHFHIKVSERGYL